MAISINSGFELLSSEVALDSRCLYDTKADMAAAVIGIYEGCVCYCKEDKKYYSFNPTNEEDPEIGFWREQITGGGGAEIDDTINESTTKTYSISKIHELMGVNGGYVLVDELPNILDEEVRASLDPKKIYLVPLDDPDDADNNVKIEYIYVYKAHADAVYAEAIEEDKYTLMVNYLNETYGGTGTVSEPLEPFITDPAQYATYVSAIETSNESLPEEEQVAICSQDEFVRFFYGCTDNETEFTYPVDDYEAYKTACEAYVLVPEVAETYAWEKIGALTGSAGLNFDEDFEVTNPVGKMTAGVNVTTSDVVIDVLKRMLTKDIPTSMTFVGDPSASTLFEKHVSTITSPILTAVISKGTAEIADNTPITIKRGEEVIHTDYYLEADGDTHTTTYTDTDANLVDTTKYTVEIGYTLNGEPKTASSSITYTFALPIFYGGSATKEIADVTALTKVVEKAGTKKFSYTVTNGYCAIAIPASMSITKITDQNQFDNTNSFDFVTASVTIGSESVPYNVYTTKNSVTCNGFVYTFEIA